MPPSPGWHRRLRLRRSKARQLVRRGKDTKRALARLLLHHATPDKGSLVARYQCAFMGKHDQQKPPWHKNAYWSYWHGSWKQRTPKTKGRGADNDSEEGHFPGYDTMNVTSTSSTASLPTTTTLAMDQAGGQGQDYLKAMQKSINNNRRIGGRFRKITEDVETKKQQWKAFERHVQAVYLQQKKQFQQDMESLAREAKELEHQRVTALQQLMETVELQRAGGTNDRRTAGSCRLERADWRASGAGLHGVRPELGASPLGCSDSGCFCTVPACANSAKCACIWTAPQISCFAPSPGRRSACQCYLINLMRCPCPCSGSAPGRRFDSACTGATAKLWTSLSRPSWTWPCSSTRTRPGGTRTGLCIAFTSCCNEPLHARACKH